MPQLQRMSLRMIRETEIERPKLRQRKLNQKLEVLRVLLMETEVYYGPIRVQGRRGMLRWKGARSAFSRRGKPQHELTKILINLNL